jgi:hypothetical protein
VEDLDGGGVDHAPPGFGRHGREPRGVRVRAAREGVRAGACVDGNDRDRRPAAVRV